ncbi:MAG: hypothetical protein V1926_00575 [Candidatus Peregrinibacteria bacterium]
MPKTCPLTGLPFTVSSGEMALRKKLGVEGEPEFHPIARWQILGAFWQHWALHKRKCDKTGKQIISVFSEDCPYPVWHKDEWVKHAAPPSADIDLTQPIFPQMWELFRRCPISHNMGIGNENCEYTDDWWYSKNCHLCHSGDQCEDLRYCYRVANVSSSQYAAYSFMSERCCDLTNAHNCFRVIHAFNCWHCADSAFLYDCRNCNYCMFCSNLRNKSYCFTNEQLTKEEYAQRVRAWDLRSRKAYERARREFRTMLRERSWHRALFIDRCEHSTGDYLDECMDCENCFFISGGVRDGINVFRCHKAQDCLDCVSPFKGQLCYCTSLAQDDAYMAKFCCNITQSRFMEYSVHCFQCQHCFGCCGLVGKKYHIFNKPFPEADYEREKQRIIAAMKSTGEYGKFFPGHFAANPYEESIAGFYWPLTAEQGRKLGLRMREREEERAAGARDASEVPDCSDQADESITSAPYWDPVAKRPFQILQEDILFAQDLGVPLPYTYYMRRLQENFRLIPFDGTLRDVACGKCQKQTQTGWLKEYDGRILCEECYLKEVY